MYHETKFVQKETVSGAACSISCHSNRDDSDLTVLAFSLYRTTFYIVDINCPKRLQTLKMPDPVKQKYFPTELCENLAQNYEGFYRSVLHKPKTVFFHFAKE